MTNSPDRSRRRVLRAGLAGATFPVGVAASANAAVEGVDAASEVTPLALLSGVPETRHSRLTGVQQFRDDFVWGAGTSSYQIEGSPIHGGGGESIWDVFCRQPGAIRDGHSGNKACDHINRYREDVALMRKLGLNAYRFSLSWPRLFPEGNGRRNPAGFDFYDRLVDALLDAGVTPWITLFHWDYPQALQARGGWRVRESASWFADYAQACVARYSDRVSHWLTFNEPEVFIRLGHHLGVHAPGIEQPWAPMLRVAHHVMLAHGLGVQAMRAAARQPLQVGYVSALHPGIPASESTADIEAARRFSFGGLAGWLMEPVYRGEWPAAQLAEYGEQVPVHDAHDLRTMAQPLDFFAMNIYQGAVVRAAEDGSAQVMPREQGNARTAFALFDVTPQALRWGPRWYFEQYGLPVVVTENGMSLTDWISREGRVDDPQRIDFLHRYLYALREAVRDGVDVRGYFAWSLLDNFEWAEGYRERFGLVFVDWATQRRLPKASFDWYGLVIASNGESL